MRRGDLAKLSILMATVFVDMMGFLMVLPLLPFYAERLGADPVVVTLLVAAFAFAQLLTSPFWGRFSDRLGRRPMIILGLLVSAAAFVLFGWASGLAGEDTGEGPGTAGFGLWVLFASRLIQGAGGGTTGVVQAYVSDVVLGADRAKALGWISAATSAGVTLGPALGSLAARWGESAPGFLAAGLCLANAAFAWKLLPEPQRDDGAEGEGGAEGESGAAEVRPSIRQALVRVLSHPGREIHALIYVYALGMMAFMAMNSVIALFLERRFGATDQTIGWFYVYIGALSLVMRAAVLGPVVARIGEVRTLRLGALSAAAGLLLVPFTGTLGVGFSAKLACLALAAGFIPVGTALLFPATTSQISGRARRGETGQTLGVQQTFGGVSRVVGPVWAGFAFRDLGVETPFWIAAALMVGVFLLGLRVRPLGEAERRTAEARLSAEEEGV
jgi:MFS family permease